MSWRLIETLISEIVANSLFPGPASLSVLISFSLLPARAPAALCSLWVGRTRLCSLLYLSQPLGDLTVPLNLLLGLCMLLSQQEEESGDRLAGFPRWA